MLFFKLMHLIGMYRFFLVTDEIEEGYAPPQSTKERQKQLHTELWGSDEEERHNLIVEIRVLAKELGEHYANQFQDGFVVRPKPWDAKWHWRFINAPGEIKIWRVPELHRPLWVGRDGHLYFCWSVGPYGRPGLVRLAKFEERDLSGLKKLSGSLRIAVQKYDRTDRPWSPREANGADK